VCNSNGILKFVFLKGEHLGDTQTLNYFYDLYDLSCLNLKYLVQMLFFKRQIPYEYSCGANNS